MFPTKCVRKCNNKYYYIELNIIILFSECAEGIIGQEPLWTPPHNTYVCKFTMEYRLFCLFRIVNGRLKKDKV